MADPKQVQIRNMEPRIWRELKIEAVSRGVPLHDLVRMILDEWLAARFVQG